MSTDAHSTVHAGEDLSADEYGDHQHGATDKQYIIIALILCVITAAEVTLTYIDVGPLFLPALLIMMAAKFLVVVSYFMHLKFDNKMFSFLFYMGLGLAVFVYAVALATFNYIGS
jgi:cytochrome c oxidase subunit 4